MSRPTHPFQSNFEFLASHEPQLSRLGALAERYFGEDPATSLIKLRQYAELLVKQVAARHAAYEGERETFEEILRRLSAARLLPREAADAFHALRKFGNAAAHENIGTHAQALSGLKIARQLGIWFHRAYGSQPNFAAGSFAPPTNPPAANSALQAEIEALRTKLLASESAADAARRRAEEEAREREALGERLAREAEERAFWECLATEAEAERSRVAAALEAIQSASAAAPQPNSPKVQEASRKAAQHIVIDEADTRALIDAQLQAMGWEADWTRLRHAFGTRPGRGRAVAIAEWPTESGPVDYALFVDEVCVGVIEAKRASTNVPSVLEQAKRYSQDILLDGGQSVSGGPFQHDVSVQYRAPFVFASNGRPYLKQLETMSGIWFWDARVETNRAVALPEWFSPRDLKEKLEQELDTSIDSLRQEPFDETAIRPYQRSAIRAIEEAIGGGRREILVAMATGTGKTMTCIALMYRLLKHKRFRRILFLVDRTTLAEQTLTAFDTTEAEALLKFSQIYNVAGLGETPEPQDRVHVATVQSMVKRIFGEDDGEARPSPGLYDLVIVDEAHRGYALDAEMREGDIEFRDTADYLSKYRRVVEYFDAVRVGLTATPALHTTQIFGDPVFHYGYRQAVVDGYLIDHQPPKRIITALSQAGISFEGGEEVTVLDPRTGQIDLFTTEDQVNFEIDTFNKKVLTPEFNRVVAEAIASEVPPDGAGKTLIFAVRDSHADTLVDELRKALESRYGLQPHDLVMKITGAPSVDDPSGLIRRFRNDARPKYVVTVDLLTTGVDVPAITTLVFVRRVNSRILYEQMIGRATRRCDGINKTEFRIYDAVDLYANLQAMTDMRPVVVRPNLPLSGLIGDLERAPTDEDRIFVRDQIVVKLRTRLRGMGDAERAAFEEEAGYSSESLLGRVRTANPVDTAIWFRARPKLVEWLDRKPDAAPDPLWVSTHPDELIRIEDVFGPGTTPEDYLREFEAFVKANMNALPAMIAATQRPRELTRKELKELASLLDAQGFSETKLRAAYGRARNADIAAHILGFVRQAALGDPLVPYEVRVDRAISRIEASRTWTPKQRQWLARLAKALKEVPVSDREILDAPAFRQLGGFRVANRDFEAGLDAILKDLNETIWTTQVA